MKADSESEYSKENPALLGKRWASIGSAEPLHEI
jgi:hypothetical protein